MLCIKSLFPTRVISPKSSKGIVFLVTAILGHGIPHNSFIFLIFSIERLCSATKSCTSCFVGATSTSLALFTIGLLPLSVYGLLIHAS
jgi:hypothetical protein